MSRAFTKESDGEETPPKRYELPARDDPAYDEAAAWALLEGANQGDSMSAEAATGYRWGARELRPSVQRILEQARERDNERLQQLAERFLRG